MINKRIIAISCLLILLFVSVVSVWAIDRRAAMPKVRYIYPKDEAEVDLSAEENLVFKWKSTPMPGGGRQSYKFDIFKEFSYEVVVSEILKHNIYSIEIPAETFEDGALYTWQVKQRDAKTRTWSMDYRWSFRVKK